MEDMPLPRSRAFARKVKTGCKTCRIRRVKCDEQKPSCQRCCSTGRTCDGYDHIPSLTKPAYTLAVDVVERSQESRALHFFRTVTTEQLSGDFDSEFWNRHVRQAIHTSSTLRHAAMALACLHEKFLMHGSLSDSLYREAMSGFGLRQYTTAIRDMWESLKSNRQPLVVTLMCSVLFFCLESLCGRVKSAAMHLRNGLGILRASRPQVEISSVASQTIINDDIFHVFARQGFQASYFVDRTDSVNQVQLITQLQAFSQYQSISIDSLEEARNTLHSCLNGTMFSDHAEALSIPKNSFSFRYNTTPCAQLILSGSNSARFLEGKERAISALQNWNATFKTFLHQRERFMNQKDIRGSTLLKLHHLVAKLILTSGCGSAESDAISQSNLHEFKQVIAWTKVIISDGDSASVATISSFSPDVGIIAPMFFVATNCRDRTICAEAAQILESESRREGVWDSDTALKILKELNISTDDETR